MARIFLSYRRADSEGYTGRLRDHLLKYFETGDIFRDVDIIKPGDDFVHAIDTFIATCNALIAVIGPEWLTIKKDGIRRLDDPHDYVRLEIAAALRRNIRVIPVLVERATMPREHDLPPDIAGLARRNAVELSSDRFEYDVERIAHAIGGSESTLIIKYIFKANGTVSIFDNQKLIAQMNLRNPLLVSKVQVNNGEHILYAKYRWNSDRDKVDFSFDGLQRKKTELDTSAIVVPSDALMISSRVGQTLNITAGLELVTPAQYEIMKLPLDARGKRTMDMKSQTLSARYRLVLKPY